MPLSALLPVSPSSGREIFGLSDDEGDSGGSELSDVEDVFVGQEAEVPEKAYFAETVEGGSRVVWGYSPAAPQLVPPLYPRKGETSQSPGNVRGNGLTECQSSRWIARGFQT